MVRNYVMLIIPILAINVINAQPKDVLLGYIHNQILQKNVPEYERFCKDCTNIFRTQNPNQKKVLTVEIRKFADNLIKDLNEKLKNQNLTIAEKNAVLKVIELINDKVSKL